MRHVSAVAALLRRLRTERGVAVFLFVLIAITSFVVASAPRLFNRIADEGLRYEAIRSTAVQRNLQLTRVDHLPAVAGDPFGRVVARGTALKNQFPNSVRAVIGEERFVVETTRFQLAQPPRYPTYFTLRFQDGLDDQIQLTEGRWPAHVEPDQGAAPGTPPLLEVAISDATAEAIGAELGVYHANVDPGDPMLRNFFPRPSGPVDLAVVGTFTVRDTTAPYWFEDLGLAQIAVGGTADSPIAFATALFAADAYDDVLALELPNRYAWRSFLDVNRLDAGELDTLVPELVRMEAEFSTVGATRPGSTLLRTGLPDIVDRYLRQRATSEAALSVAALGPLTVAAGAVALVGLLLVRRRRPALLLMRGRGASGAQLLIAQFWEGVLITMPAAFLGLAAATVLVPARNSALSPVGAVLVALAATALLVGATWPVAARARQPADRDDQPVLRLAPRRLVVELTVVALSVLATWLLRERGLGGPASGARPAGFDPFLAAAPLLSGVAVGLLTIRLYPLPVRALGWLSAKRRDLVPVLGLRNLGRHPSAGNLPLLILTLTVAVGTFSSVVQTSIARSQLEVSWQEVAADYRIDTQTGGPLPATLDVANAGGAEAVASALLIDDAPLSTGPGNRFEILLEAVEPAAYEQVLADSPVALGIPPWFTIADQALTPGTPEAPIPAVISTRRPNGLDPLVVNDAFTITLRGKPITFRVGGIRETFPGIAATEPFVIASFDLLETAVGGDLAPNVMFVRGAADLQPALAGLVGSGVGAPRVTSRHETYAGMQEAPLVAAVVAGFALALAVAAAYAALAVVAVVVLHAQRRSRDTAYLRTLGLTERQGTLLMLVEYGLPLGIALFLGVALGLALAWLLSPGLDLAAFSRAGVTVFLRVDWLSVGLVALAVATSVGLAVAGSSRLARRLDVGQSLRAGDV